MWRDPQEDGRAHVCFPGRVCPVGAAGVGLPGELELESGRSSRPSFMKFGPDLIHSTQLNRDSKRFRMIQETWLLG